MSLTPARVPERAVRRLAGTLYGYAFCTDLVLLYPVYTLLFSDTGLSVNQISSLFVIWAVAGVVLEVPSGALADTVSRRLLLRLAPLPVAAGFALWVLAPSYWSFALGFVLWGAGSALTSGALEALVWTELDRLGAAGRYARTIGQARTAGVLGALASGVLAGPALAVGGYPAVGLASVLVCLVTAAVAAGFPEHGRPRHHAAPTIPPLSAPPTSARTIPAPSIPPLPAPPTSAPSIPAPIASARTGRDRATPDRGPADGAASSARAAAAEEAELGWWGSLRAGVAEARADRRVRAAVLLVCVVTAIWGALDEYTPLLALDTGLDPAAVPLLLLLIWGGATVGGLLAPLGERLGPGGYAGLLGVAAGALALGALTRHPAGFVALGVAFGAFQLATVLADARLQARISGPSRATVTSLAGMATSLTTVAVYAGYGLVATAGGNAVAFTVAAVPYLVVALRLAWPRRAVTALAVCSETATQRSASVPGDLTTSSEETT
ncbi:MFS transporter [Micromonospora rosaria]|uniref:MFS transporter n=1 Tax=Micromonospora rosaria TaxID=47874 RepID=UPI0009FD9EF6|nr:MFS transporter [Micromonospora rosaria]